MTSPENAFWKEYCNKLEGLGKRCDDKTYPELSHVQRDVFVVRVKNNSTDARITPCSVNQK